MRRARALLLIPVLLLASPSDAARNSLEVGTEVEKDHYTISARRGRAGVAERGHITITVTAKDGYTLDHDKNIVVSTGSSPRNLEWGQRRFTREDGQLSDDGQQFEMKVPFRAARIGEYKVKGRVRFKVCKADKCKLVVRRWKTAAVAH